MGTNNKAEAAAAKTEQEAQAKMFRDRAHGEAPEDNEAHAKVIKRRNSYTARTEDKCKNCERGFYLIGDNCEFASCGHTKGSKITNEAMPGYGEEQKPRARASTSCSIQSLHERCRALEVAKSAC